ncbi:MULTISPECIES: hypothetical protein [Streptomyces rochei group]|uniref:Apea-like HEPN domain-containing protein n=1 Tax=Streptomyces plicatus TaxID=1922 RepID=A0ABW1XWK1_STRPL|nr:hypothetical protein [Streptomyces plicatus]
MQRLDQLVDRGKGTLSYVHHRILLPGSTPLRAEGLFRFEPVGPVDQLGSTPGFLASVGWIEDGDHQATTPSFGGMSRELAAVLTLITGRRIEAFHEQPISMEGRPNRITYLPVEALPDRSLIGPIKPTLSIDDEIREFLGKARSLQRNEYVAISAAVDLHYGACLLFGRDLTAAYTLLVAGLETLAQCFYDAPTSWEEWDQAPRWEKFIRVNNLNDSQARALRYKLLDGAHIRLKAKFVDYASTRVEERFFDETWRDYVPTISMPEGKVTGGQWGEAKKIRDFLPDTRDALRASLKKTYDARSGFVHQEKKATTLTQEAIGLIGRTSPSKPLPFALLRAVLGHLIRLEVRDKATSSDTPDVSYTFSHPAGT